MKANSKFEVATATSFFISKFILPNYSHSNVSVFNETKAIKGSQSPTSYNHL